MTRIRVSGVNELVLEVVDLARALAFYEGVLGFPVVGRSEERAWLMAGERTRIGLWTPQVGLAGGRGGVHVHYAFGIDEADFDWILARFESAGYATEIHSFEDEGRGRAVYVQDPDGNVVEFWTWDVRGHLAVVA